MGIPYSLTTTKYNEKTYASYMPSGWYKSLWKFMSNPLFKFEFTKDYKDLPVLRKKDEYLTKAFVAGGYQNTDLKSLNFVRKFIQAVTLADISIADGSRISFQSYEGIESRTLQMGNYSAKWELFPLIRHGRQLRPNQLFYTFFSVKM